MSKTFLRRTIREYRQWTGNLLQTQQGHRWSAGSPILIHDPMSSPPIVWLELGYFLRLMRLRE